MAHIGLWMYPDDGGDVIEAKLTARLEGLGHAVLGRLDMRGFFTRDGRVYTAEGRDLSALDVLYHMNADQQTENQFDQLFALGRSGVAVVNAPRAYADARDKPVANQLLRQAGLPVPRSLLASPRSVAGLADDLVSSWGGVVVKPRDRHGGKGVMLFERADQLRDLMDAFSGAPNIYCEEFIRFGDVDHRVEIVADAAIGGYSRRRTHAFKTNVSAGGLMTGNPPSAEMEALALAAARVLGLTHTIVDLLRRESDGRLFIIEVNPIMGIFVEQAMRVSPKTSLREVDASYAHDDQKLDLLAAHIDAVARRGAAVGAERGR